MRGAAARAGRVPNSPLPSAPAPPPPPPPPPPRAGLLGGRLEARANYCVLSPLISAGSPRITSKPAAAYCSAAHSGIAPPTRNNCNKLVTPSAAATAVCCRWRVSPGRRPLLCCFPDRF
ncbi:T-cell leukemia homeobox protein 3-like [Schistocerca americana]|uniref:T-cell leukemia homeobox protein 3-like n=1 Tax=Schistocerca americana TaxID=7009 RepID=UPI001F4F9F30|nr:T-cell leukemia homeobox protein 3-like [Schistocerca americana]